TRVIYPDSSPSIADIQLVRLLHVRAAEKQKKESSGFRAYREKTRQAYVFTYFPSCGNRPAPVALRARAKQNPFCPTDSARWTCLVATRGCHYRPVRLRQQNTKGIGRRS